MCAAKWHVRFTPESDRESGHPQTAMSALPLKADMCGALVDVRFGPKADMAIAYARRSPDRPHPRSVNGESRGDEAVFNSAPGSFWTYVKSRPPSVGGLTHFEVKTVPESRPPSEPFSIVLLKRMSAAVAMASFI